MTGPSPSDPSGTSAAAAPRQPYSFEAQDSTYRSPDRAIADLVAFRANLGLARDTDDNDTPLLREFVIHHHLNIAWYQTRIRNEQMRQRLFLAITVGLLIVIPVVTYIISGQPSRNGAVVAAQLTAVLTGILGFQNAMRSYLERRGFVTIFHQAASKLKKAVYNFEQRWAGCVPRRDVPEFQLFLNSLRDATRKARDVEDDEEEAFFTAQAALPSIDLKSTLLDASQGAATLVARQLAQGAGAGAPERLQAARTAVDSLRSKLTSLKASAFGLNDAKQQRLVEQSIASTQQQLRDAEQTLMRLTIRSTDSLS